MPLADFAFQKCISPACGHCVGAEEVRSACPKCGDLLDVIYDWDKARPPKSLSYFEQMWSRRNEPLRLSGIYRFHELLPFATPDSVVTVGEGQTMLQLADGVAQFVGMKAGRLYLQYEGLNPSGSFKDNGMSAAFTHARA
ncbi:MAG: threonine synthase, partial [Planctomycetia bacterium]|nr:threonine synthase [Planctomycetia bacterium]